jgi:hypothetical protein
VDSDPDPRIHASDEWIRILDLDPAIFVIDLQDAIKKTNFFCLLLFDSVADPDPALDPDPPVLGLPDPDPLVRGMDPDPALDPDPSIIVQK